jgi:hypothetical protein
MKGCAVDAAYIEDCVVGGEMGHRLKVFWAAVCYGVRGGFFFACGAAGHEV